MKPCIRHIGILAYTAFLLSLCGCTLAQNLGLAQKSLPLTGTIIVELPQSLEIDGKHLRPLHGGLSQLYRFRMTPDGAILYGEYEGNKPKSEGIYYLWRPGGKPEPAGDKSLLPRRIVDSTEVVYVKGKEIENILNGHRVAWEKRYGTEGTYAQWQLYAATPDLSIISGTYRSKTEDESKQKRVHFVYREGIGFEDPSDWLKTIFANGGLKLPSYVDDTSSFHTMPEQISADGTTMVFYVPNNLQYVVYNPSGFGAKGRCIGIDLDELGVRGTISAVSREQWTVSVSKITAPNGKITPLSPPRPKTIVIPKGLTIPAGAQVGAKVRVIGLDCGKGKPLTARAVELTK